MLQVLRFVPIAHAVNEEHAFVLVHDRLVGDDGHERSNARARGQQPQIAAARLQARLDEHAVHIGVKQNRFARLEVAQARTHRTALDAGDEKVERIGIGLACN